MNLRELSTRTSFGVYRREIMVLLFVSMMVVGPGTKAAHAQAQGKVERQAAVDQKEKAGFGRFVSFNDGTLTIENNSGVLIAWNNIAEIADTFRYDPASNEYERIKGTAAALNDVNSGTYIMVGPKQAHIRIGARKDEVIGTFVSFKDNRLMTLGKNLPDNFVKRYGKILHYNRFRDDVPVYETVDGGAYELLGTADKILANIKEGTILTVIGEGDDNITRINIGKRKSN